MEELMCASPNHGRLDFPIHFSRPHFRRCGRNPVRFSFIRCHYLLRQRHFGYTLEMAFASIRECSPLRKCTEKNEWKFTRPSNEIGHDTRQCAAAPEHREDENPTWKNFSSPHCSIRGPAAPCWTLHLFVIRIVSRTLPTLVNNTKKKIFNLIEDFWFQQQQLASKTKTLQTLHLIAFRSDSQQLELYTHNTIHWLDRRWCSEHRHVRARTFFFLVLQIF